MSNETGPVFLEGHISVRSALAGGYRDVSNVYVNKERLDPDIIDVRGAAEKSLIPVHAVDSIELAALTRNPKCTDAAAEIGERRHLGAEALISVSPQGWFVALDGVEDPYNFGGALRALYAAGAAGVFVGPRNWYSASTVVARSSAGASELMPSAVVSEVGQLAELAATHDFELIVAAEGLSSISLFEADLSHPLILVIGGERRGVSRKMLAAATKIVRIPYGREEFSSLGTISASTAIGFEILRQRQCLATGAVAPKARSGSQPAPQLPRTRLPRKPWRGF